MPSKQVEEVYEAGGFSGGPLDERIFREPIAPLPSIEATYRRHALADAASALAEMERNARDPYATAYRNAKERILSMIVEQA